jgi:ABC-2 type transport system permease protein
MKLAHQWVAFCTIVRKEVTRFVRIWVQTLIPPVITMGLYFVIFGHLIGGRIGQMGSFDYMTFVVPGLVMMSVINNAYSNVVSSFFSAKFNRSIEELMVSPTPSYIILIGYVFGGMLRGLAVGAIVTLVSLFFASFQLEHVGITILVVILASLLFSLAGLINAIFANSFDDISIVPTFVLTPLTYFGGVFYSIDLLPDFWQTVSQFNPILYLVNAFRYGFLGVSDVNISVALTGTVVCVVALYLCAWWLLAKGKRLRS